LIQQFKFTNRKFLKYDQASIATQPVSLLRKWGYWASYWIFIGKCIYFHSG